MSQLSNFPLIGVTNITFNSVLEFDGMVKILLEHNTVDCKKNNFYFISLWYFFLKMGFVIKKTSNSYLPGWEVNRDHEGGSSRARPFHCTSVGLTPAISPNVGNSTA